MVRRPDGSVVFESRAEQGLSIDHVNLKEKERFMNGDKVSTKRVACEQRGRRAVRSLGMKPEAGQLWTRRCFPA